MKLLRCENVGKEVPAVLDENGIIRDLSTIISDLTPNTINKSTIEKIEKKDLSKLPEIKKSVRIGPCVSNPEKFIGIGLNYSAHAKETQANTPKEPIVFLKPTVLFVDRMMMFVYQKTLQNLIGKLSWV